MKTVNFCEKFEKVIKELNINKIPYNLEISKYNAPMFLDINYNGLRALIYNEYVYDEDKRIFANHSKLFNKMGDCKVQLQLPENELQMRYLFEVFKKVSTKTFYTQKEEREFFFDYPIGRDLKKMYNEDE